MSRPQLHRSQQQCKTVKLIDWQNYFVAAQTKSLLSRNFLQQHWQVNFNKQAIRPQRLTELPLPGKSVLCRVTVKPLPNRWLNSHGIWRCRIKLFCRRNTKSTGDFLATRQVNFNKPAIPSHGTKCWKVTLTNSALKWHQQFKFYWLAFSLRAHTLVGQSRYAGRCRPVTTDPTSHYSRK